MRRSIFLAAFGALVLVFPSARQARAEPEVKAVDSSVEFSRKDDVIYGRHHGVAFTMDVFAPKEKPNGRGVVFCISAGWVSDKVIIKLDFLRPFLKRGYTVFAVMHGSQPKYTIPEIAEQMHRAVQFIRAHAKEYGVDAERLGVTGASAGGHLSLLLGTSGRPARLDAKDPVARESSRVAAVGCFFPPTDFANYGKEGESVIGRGGAPVFMAPFDFKDFDGATGMYVPVTDEAKKRATLRSISPVSYVSKESAPALIFHGDADMLVPLQQSELIVERYKRGGVPCELVVKKGAGHGWKGIEEDVDRIADWFDKYLGR
jgi:acetyl esterase/lipase